MFHRLSTWGPLGAALCIVAVSPLVAPTNARAGNDEGVLFGSEASLTSGSVTATTSEGSALWYNPAGLAAVSNGRLDVSGSAFMLRLYHVPQFLRTATGGGGPDANIAEIVSIPAAATYVRRLGPRVQFGAGIFVPVHGDYILRASFITPSGSQWVNTITEQSDDTHAGVGVGLEVTPTLRIGTSFFGAYQSSKGASQLLGGLASKAGMDSFASESSLRIFRAVSFEAGFGVQWAPLPALRLGAALRTPAVQVFQSTQLTDVSTAATPAAATPSSKFEPVLVDNGAFRLGVVTPLKLRAGVAWLAGRASVALDTDLTLPHVPKDDDVRALNWNVRAGARMRTRDDLAVGAGVFTDRSPFRDPSVQRERSLDFYGGTVGVEFGNTLTVSNGPAPELSFATTLGLRYAYGTGEIKALQVDADGGIGSVPTTLTVHEIGVNIGSTLRF